MGADGSSVFADRLVPGHRPVISCDSVVVNVVAAVGHDTAAAESSDSMLAHGLPPTSASAVCCGRGEACLLGYSPKSTNGTNESRKRLQNYIVDLHTIEQVRYDIVFRWF